MAKTAASSSIPGKSAKESPSTSGQSGGAIEMLKQDHRKVEGLFEQFERSNDNQEKEQLARQICAELIVHTRLEEEIFYPACRAAGVEHDNLDEAQVEHDGAKLFVNDLLQSEAGSPFWEAKVSVLSEMIRHHVEEEEKPGEGTFAKAREKGINDTGLSEQLKRRKQELQGRAAGTRPIRVVSIHPSNQEVRMPRYGTPERDERGRFMSDDDDRDYGRRRSYRHEDDDDYRGGRRHGGWYDDSEGHSEAARERYGERRYGSRYEDDDDYRRGGRGHGGWYGDPEGHSEAARERYGERRYSSRYEDDGDDYRRGGGRGHGGWYGDPEGHSEAARERWGESRRSSRYDEDDDYRGRRNAGHGGWFGDSRGHAEASRQGWRHRR